NAADCLPHRYRRLLGPARSPSRGRARSVARLRSRSAGRFPTEPTTRRDGQLATLRGCSAKSPHFLGKGHALSTLTARAIGTHSGERDGVGCFYWERSPLDADARKGLGHDVTRLGRDLVVQLAHRAA